MYYFNCEKCQSTQKGWLLSILTSYVSNTITKHYKCDTCRQKTLVSFALPESQQVEIPKDYQAS